jgi:diaminohydroxyphosphoribosylaminopyrimidine deaminase/5-amino-6-(5-phosphoribosylamino)uracil reductase
MDARYLQRCAYLATLADGRVGNNPRVGSVLVHDGRIIGEGYHKVAGQAHAEVNCLTNVRIADRPLIPAATLYVSLEPCCITGRSGACTDVIRREGIKTVVFAQRDTTPGVNGASTAILQAAGVTVREYPDFAPTLAVNAHRRTMTTLGRPHIILKYAQSADGFLRPANREEKYWITNDISRRLVHRWRADTAAILVGGRTITEDDPRLNTRLFSGPDPRPVLLDLRDRVTGREKVFAGDLRPILFAGSARAGLRAEIHVVSNKLDQAALTQVLGKLLAQGYGSVLVEGGAGILSAFLAAGLWDEARVFTGTEHFGAGLAAPTLPATADLSSLEHILGDRLACFVNTAPVISAPLDDRNVS